MSYDDGEHGADVASKRGATTLQEAREVLLEALNYLEGYAETDLDNAVLAAHLDDGDRMPQVHAALMHYFRQLQPHLVARAPKRWDGSHYNGDDGPEVIATVKIPRRLMEESSAPTRYETEDIDKLADLQNWSMRTREYRQQETRVYLSPGAVHACYQQLFEVQSGIGLHVQGRDGGSRQSGGPSRI